MADEVFHGLVQVQYGRVHLGGQGAGQVFKIQVKAPAPGQALAARQHHRGAGLQGQAGGQGHGVGRLAKEGCPLALAVGRHLVGQQAHGLAFAQGLDHLAHAREGGGHGLDAAAVAGAEHHLRQPGLLGRAVKDGDWPMLRRPARGRALHRQLKAAQVRG